MESSLRVMESFATIQGEGHYSGTPAYFIRLGGCDVGCTWCDVKDSWPVDHPEKKILDLVHEVQASNLEHVIITGGEPFMQDLTFLTSELHHHDLQTHVETAGVYPLTGQWDWITFSPKKFKEPLMEYFLQANELKVIVYNKSDLAWGEELRTKVSESCICYFQPEWSKMEKVMPQIVDFVKSNPAWRVSLQDHKFMNIP